MKTTKKKLFLLLCFPISLFGQHNYQEPEDFNLGMEVFDVYFSVFDYSYFPSFSPIGWSKDGCFAFREGIAGEFSSNDAVSVYSMITDNNIATLLLDEKLGRLDGGYEQNDNWDEHSDSINQLLYKYKIHDGKFGEFNTSPYIDEYKIVLGKKNSSFNLSLESKTPDTSLIIVEKEFEEDIFFVGYFLSPFENRIAIVLIEAGIAEGEDRFWNLHIYGKKIPESNY